jgi:hypothetical protein
LQTLATSSAVLVAANAHDGRAHGCAAEGDRKSEQQEQQREPRRLVFENEPPQIRRLTSSRPPTAMMATTIPPARLIANSRSSGWRQNFNVGSGSRIMNVSS